MRQQSDFTIERACLQALHWHAGQVDKQGQPYILHPFQVMLAVPERSRIVAVLHDVLEDTDATADYFEQYLAPVDLEALILVTRPPRWLLPDQPTYADYIRRIATAPGEAGDIAREVKLADLRDNFDRLGDLDHTGLYDRYSDALKMLGGVPA